MSICQAVEHLQIVNDEILYHDLLEARIDLLLAGVQDNLCELPDTWSYNACEAIDSSGHSIRHRRYRPWSHEWIYCTGW